MLIITIKLIIIATGGIYAYTYLCYVRYTIRTLLSTCETDETTTYAINGTLNDILMN